MSDDFTAEMPLPEKPQRRPALRLEREAERLSVGSFYAEHRALIDARKGDLSRIGMGPAPAAPAIQGPHELPSQTKVLAMPTLQDEPLLLPTTAPLVPENAPATYAAPKLPKLLGVNEHLTE